MTAAARAKTKRVLWEPNTLRTPPWARLGKLRKTSNVGAGACGDLGAQGGSAEAPCMKQCAWRKHGLHDTRLAEDALLSSETL